MLKYDGSFNLPIHTTSYIARLQYCLNLIFLLTIDSVLYTPPCILHGIMWNFAESAQSTHDLGVVGGGGNTLHT